MTTNELFSTAAGFLLIVYFALLGRLLQRSRRVKTEMRQQWLARLKDALPPRPRVPVDYIDTGNGRFAGRLRVKTEMRQQWLARLKDALPPHPLPPQNPTGRN